ncbi:MAG: hypothetical protein AB1921_20105 [Thermodesulfobacteriota bacterium]
MRVLTALVTALAVWAVAAPGALAQSAEFYATRPYVMGAYDTKGDAKTMSFFEVRKLLLKKAVDYLAAQPSIAALGFSREELASYVPELSDISLMSEEITVSGDDITISSTAKISVDADRAAKELARIRKDPSYGETLRKKQEDLAAMETRIRDLQSQLALLSDRKIAYLTKKRDVAYQGLEAATMAALAEPAPLSRAAGQTEKRTVSVKTAPAGTGDVMKLRTGMNYDDMLRVAGAPASKAVCGEKIFYQYGDIFVYTAEGKVRAYVTSQDWKGPCHPYVGFMGELKYF